MEDRWLPQTLKDLNANYHAQITEIAKVSELMEEGSIDGIFKRFAGYL